MTLKVIGAGFGRTGTMSTYAALNELGFPCYHMVELLQNPANRDHVEFWRQVANSEPGTQHDWEKVFKNYSAALDNPACCVWKELAEAYPDAKVLLTLHPRGADAWYDSTMDTIYFTQNTWQYKVLEIFTSKERRFGEMARKLIWQRFLRGTMEDREKAKARYENHIEEVKAAIPPERLLVFSVDQGWEPLCEFLGVEVPEKEFPNVNERANLMRSVRNSKKRAYKILAALGAGALVLLLILSALF
ncbi:sulfotransferase family protein [Amaricoccus tamworthensis]|uniref:sulfotransferase family protein n=1 Tax=Amaricoccus tamworthensis TaxID=57002 RepID=UPI003C7BBBBF